MRSVRNTELTIEDIKLLDENDKNGMLKTEGITNAITLARTWLKFLGLTKADIQDIGNISFIKATIQNNKDRIYMSGCIQLSAIHTPEEVISKALETCIAAKAEYNKEQENG